MNLSSPSHGSCESSEQGDSRGRVEEAGLRMEDEGYPKIP